MTKSILLIGVGGQGTILISRILSSGFAEMGFDVKMSEIHGMSQRGGSVTTMIRYGDEVHSPNFGDAEADVIISFEKSEAVRALPQLKKGGTVITDDYEIFSVPVLTGASVYPFDALDQLRAEVPNTIVIEAYRAAESWGTADVRISCCLANWSTQWAGMNTWTGRPWWPPMFLPELWISTSEHMNSDTTCDGDTDHV